MLDGKLERDNKEEILTALDLHVVLSREVSQLSGGELQRFAIGMSCVQKADMYVPPSPRSARESPLTKLQKVTCSTNRRPTSTSSNV